MKDTMIERIRRMAVECGCGCAHSPIPLDVVRVDSGVLKEVPDYLADRGYRSVVLVADSQTYRAAGEKLHGLLEDGQLEVRLVLVPPNERGDVVADEQALVHVMLQIDPETTDVIVAAGSGTLHDISRFAAYKMSKPFLSVPTAPSVDGFNSKGAPIIVRGEKITIPASAPIAVFADLDVLAEAPSAMISAGFGDMLGKFTSLFDWRYGYLTAGEPYCDTAYAITESALQRCVQQADAIGRKDREGVRILMDALIESGLAMLVFGQSHPASGAEHHLSHYWEMEYIRLQRKQLLHGAKVGVACAVISGLYRRIGEEGLLPLDEEIRGRISALPDPDRLREWIRRTGGAATAEELGIDPELLERSLKEAHRVRINRHTLLSAYNRNGARQK